MAETLTVDLYANAEARPIALNVPLAEAFPNAGMLRAAVIRLHTEGKFHFYYGDFPEAPRYPGAAFATISPLKTSEPIGDYARAHDTASYLEAFHRGLTSIVERLEAAKAELESCGAPKDVQHEYELAVAAMTDALDAIADPNATD